MNFIIGVILVACGVFNACAKPLTPEEGQAMFLDILNTCKGEEGATEADIQEMMIHAIPTTKSGSCLNICVMEKTGIVKDGKFSVEGAVGVAGMSGDPAKAKNVGIMAVDCIPLVGNDRCDMGTKVMECLHKGSAALGINPATDLM